jgi:glycosyltransferase involved in cell wall biosynthesis
MPSVHVIVPGHLGTLTGGYTYDRRIVAGLRQRGWSVTVHELADTFPTPDTCARAEAAGVLAAIADAAIVMVDGLALGVLPDEVRPHAGRLRLVALVHHPLAEETGLDASVAAHFAETERRALQLVRRVIVTSAATARLLRAYGVDPQHMTIINPGTDPAPAARGSAGPDVELLCVASLTPRKGHEVLFRALSSLDARGGEPIAQLNWRLTCVGDLGRDPVTAAGLRTQLSAVGLDDRVALVGEKDGTALAAFYDAADVFVLPTLYEGYGMVVAEALARGLPVIASATGAIAELVTPDVGIVVPPGDTEALTAALARVIADSEYRSRLTTGARSVRDRLPTWDAACDQMVEALTRVR